MTNIPITQELVKELFDYRDGFLYHTNANKWIKKKLIGVSAGCINKSQRYFSVKISGKSYLLHRVIFLYHYGWLPEFVDHEDRNCFNNNIENLRPSTSSQNNKNKTSAKNSSSKYLGVALNSNGKTWYASICDNKNHKYLGSFKTQEEAAIVYNNAAIKLHGEFANLNVIYDSVIQANVSGLK